MFTAATNVTLFRSLVCIPNLLKFSLFTTFYAMPFYILVLIVLYRRRKIEPFDSPFFKIVFIMGIVDIIYIVHMYAFVKLPFIAIFKDFYKNALHWSHTNGHPGQNKTLWNVWPSYYGFAMVQAFGMGQYFGISMTSLNRFMALAFVMSPGAYFTTLPCYHGKYHGEIPWYLPLVEFLFHKSTMIPWWIPW